MDKTPLTPSASGPRRSFLVHILTIAAGGLVSLFPFAAGLGMILDPICRRRGGKGGNQENQSASFIKICMLDLLPEDGTPRPFVVMANVVDAWTTSPNERVGTVYLTHTSSEEGPKITAFTSTCPHLGCSIDFNPEKSNFICPCHVSGFDKNGQKLYGPSLRGLDSLSVKIVDNQGQQEIWVAYERFRTGIAERIAIG